MAPRGGLDRTSWDIHGLHPNQGASTVMEEVQVWIISHRPLGSDNPNANVSRLGQAVNPDQLT